MAKRVTVLVCGVLLFSATQAFAQLIPWKDRAFINISGGAQTVARDTKTDFTFTLYQEPASVSALRTVKGGGFFDFMAGYRVFKNFALGVQFMNRTANGDASVTALLPDPIAFDQPRNVTGSISGLVHKERWTSLIVAYGLPATDKIDIILFAGPAAVKLDHEVPSNVSVTESAGGPQLTFTRSILSRTVWGSIAGADVRYMFSKNFGAGAFVRFESANANLADDLKVEAGGAQVGGGLRIRY
jgi:hypothetical protein